VNDERALGTGIVANETTRNLTRFAHDIDADFREFHFDRTAQYLCPSIPCL
jgi:hypothetical protein